MAAGLLLCCARRVCSPAGWLNRNRVVSRAFSTTDPATTSPDHGSVNGSLMKEAKGKGWEKNWKLFKSWMVENNRNYKSEEETLQRFNNFCRTKKYVEKRNKQIKGYKLGLTLFADMTDQERVRFFDRK